MTLELDDNGQALLALALGLLLAAGLSIGGVLLWRRWLWHRQIRRRKTAITAVALAHVRNMLLPDGNGGQVYIDWLLLTTRGLLLLDVRDVRGNVFGSEHMEEWTVMRGARRNTFPNPLPPLLDRMAVIARFVPEVTVDARVLFTEGAEFPKGIPVRCLRIDSLAAEFPVVAPGAVAALSVSMAPHWDRLLAQMAPDTTRLRPL